MRRLRVATLISLTIGLAINLSGMGTWAAFTSSTSSLANSFTSGTVVLSDDDGGSTAMFTVALGVMTPNVTVSRCIAVNYTGSLPANVVLFRGSGAIGGTGLETDLNLKVTRGTGATFPTCTGFTADATNYLGAGAGVIFNTATITTYPLEAGTPIQDPPGTAEVWTNSETHVYRFDVTVKATAPDTQQGKVANAIDFVWKATNT